MAQLSVEADGTIRVVRESLDAGGLVKVLTDTMLGTLWTLQSTNARAETQIKNFLAGLGLGDYSVKVLSRSPPRVNVTSTPDAGAVTNWWMGGRL